MPIPSPRNPCRRNVTSPHGYHRAALRILMAKNGLTPLMRPRRDRGAAARQGTRLLSA